MSSNNRLETSTEILRCSFCNKDQDSVRYLIAGPAAFICDECIEVCGDIIKQSQEQAPPAETTDAQTTIDPPTVLCALCRMPTASRNALLVEDRGILCRICVEAIEAAVITAQESIT